ncbi:type 1 glutamine amidotransferase [Nocardioides sp. YIM 152588]|uniref:type 1 glutamine amidotransferase n=1 Tax=Nocardioides sp. YIM 152588 TaxID=3158259 RepID=UPI0032E3D9B4
MSPVSPDGAVLVAQHEEACPPHLLGDWLVRAGLRLDVRRLHAGDTLPADLSGHRGLVVLGGAPGAYDDDALPWLPHLRGLVRSAVATRLPTLGICLGHQVIAVALGGRVVPNPRGGMVGVRDVGWLEGVARDPLLGRLPAPPGRVLHWNHDVVVELPEGAEALAATPDGEIQAARFAPTAWGIQAHPESDEALAVIWAHSEPSPYADAAVRGIAAEQEAIAAAWCGLGPAFAELVNAPSTEPAR